MSRQGVAELPVAIVGGGFSGTLLAVNLLRGYKRAAVPMVIYAVALWGVGLPGGVTLGLHGIHALGVTPLGVSGFWIAAIIGLGSAGIGVTIYWWRVAAQPAV